MRNFPLEKWLVALALALPCVALSVSAQQQTINLGPSAIPLTGPWKFSPGDSPWLGTSSNGHFLWADPAFNDSAWAAMDLTPPPNSIDIQFGSASFLPGWTARVASTHGQQDDITVLTVAFAPAEVLHA